MAQALHKLSLCKDQDFSSVTRDSDERISCAEQWGAAHGSACDRNASRAAPARARRPHGAARPALAWQRRGSAGPSSSATSRPTTCCRRKTSSASKQTADRILAEIGIEFRDDPAAIAHWKRAGAKVDGVLVKFEPGMLREILKTAPADIHPARAQPGEIGARSAARASSSRRPTARPSSWISTRAAATARSRISATS